MGTAAAARSTAAAARTPNTLRQSAVLAWRQANRPRTSSGSPAGALPRIRQLFVLTVNPARPPSQLPPARPPRPTPPAASFITTTAITIPASGHHDPRHAQPIEESSFVSSVLGRQSCVHCAVLEQNVIQVLISPPEVIHGRGSPRTEPPRGCLRQTKVAARAVQVPPSRVNGLTGV